MSKIQDGRHHETSEIQKSLSEPTVRNQQKYFRKIAKDIFGNKNKNWSSPLFSNIKEKTQKCKMCALTLVNFHVPIGRMVVSCNPCHCYRIKSSERD